MTRLALCVALSLIACGGTSDRPTISAPVRTHAETAADRILPVLPEGAQVIIELDLARLRKNPVVGELVTMALTGEGLPPLPEEVPVSPLARADTLVLASYGVGTAQAATVVVLATPEDVPGATRLADGLVALGPAEWIAQLEARAALAGLRALTSDGAVVDDPAPPITASPELLALRDHAMPEAAPGATLRVTARLSFDARVALSRETGIDGAPAQISIWGDVADDLAIIIDADASDPGDARSREPTKRLEAAMRRVLAELAREPAIRALGLPKSLEHARIAVRGRWVRAIVAVGPARLARAVERARGYLTSLPSAPPANPPSPTTLPTTPPTSSATDAPSPASQSAPALLQGAP